MNDQGSLEGQIRAEVPWDGPGGLAGARLMGYMWVQINMVFD